MRTAIVSALCAIALFGLGYLNGFMYQEAKIEIYEEYFSGAEMLIDNIYEDWEEFPDVTMERDTWCVYRDAYFKVDSLRNK